MASTPSPTGKAPATKAAPAKKAGKPAAGKAPVAEAVKPNKAAGSVKPARPAGKSAARPPSAPEASPPKLKLVRDSFTIPKHEYAVLEELKQRAASLTRPTKKSELLRAGIVALQRMPDKAFLAAVNAVPSLKTGRPGSAVKPEDEPATAVAKKR